jgi:hypothetical protein
MDEYRKAKDAAQIRADIEKCPIFIIKTPDGYTITDQLDPSTVEVILPSK